MSKRPAGQIPQWATDANYPAGANPWNGQPTKIDPGSGQVAGGHVPLTFDPAEWENWWKNKVGIFLLQNDAIQVQNWTAPKLIDATLQPIGTGKRLGFDPVSYTLWICGTDAAGVGTSTLWLSTNGGLSWINDTANYNGFAGAALGANLAINPSDGYMYVNGIGKSTSRNPAGVYTHFVLPNAGAHGAEEGSFFDIYAGKFVWWGRDTTPHPAIWSGFETFGSIAQETLQNGNTYTGTSAVKLFAAGPTRKIAFYIQTAPAGSQGMWDVDTYGNNWTDRGPVIFNGTCQALHYNDTTGLFMAIDNTGFTYVSADGITWTQQSNYSGSGWRFHLNCLDSYGSIWLAVADGGVGKPTFAAWSKDDGVTWNRFGLPIFANVDSVKVVDDRLAIVEGGTNVAFSMRTK